MRNLMTGCLLAAFLCAASCGCSKDNGGGEEGGQVAGVTVKPAYNKSEELHNPLNGWVMYVSADYDPSYFDKEIYVPLLGKNVRVADYASACYIRTKWSVLNPADGQYAWKDPDSKVYKLVQKARELKLPIAFRVVVDGRDQGANTPQFVYDAGAEYAMSEPKYPDRKTPMPQDPIFQRYYEKLVAALDEEYNDPENTTIIDGAGDAAQIAARVKNIRIQIEAATSEYDREKLQERVAKLAGGVALIRVGAATEVEMKEKKARVEDALHATRAAVEEGVVAGGGVALIRAKQAIAKDLKGDNDEQNAGIKIVLRAMEEPLRQIVKNAGDEPSVVVNKVADGDASCGDNAQTGVYGDMIEMGVLDPTKVTRTALQNAASVASLILTTDCMVAELPEEKPLPPAGGMGGMGGMM